MKQRRQRAVIGVLLLLVVGSFLLNVGWGAVAVPPAQVFAVFMDKIGFKTDIAVGAQQAAVLWTIRLPRVLMALLVGAALAVSGVVLQGVFRNPLAEPAVLGIAGGGVVAALIVTVSGLIHVSRWFLPVGATIGALLVTLILYYLFTSDTNRDVSTFVLTGVVMNVFLAAIVTMMTFMFQRHGLGDTTAWTMGSLGGTMWPNFYVSAPVIVVATILLWRMGPELNLLLLGDTEADHLGVDTARLRRRGIVLVSIITGTAVAFAGTIAFVGLVVPHALRLLIGPDHRVLLPASLLGGAFMVALGDLFARTMVSPMELPIGVLTTIVGGPLFFYLLFRARKEGRWA